MLIKLKDYERIHHVISSVARNEGSDPAYSCLLFSVYGALILDQHFNLEPTVRTGLAAFFIGGENGVLCFGENTEDGISGSLENFHCWIEVDGWVIDFMAPAFPTPLGQEKKLTPKMFQKKRSDMALDPNDLRGPGDYFLLPADKYTESRLKQFWMYPVYEDLAEICVQWFTKYPKKIAPKVGMIGDNNSPKILDLTGPSVRVRW